MYNFCFHLEHFIIPLVIQGEKYFFCFNLILATRKPSLYSESIMLKKRYMFDWRSILLCSSLYPQSYLKYSNRLAGESVFIYKFLLSIFLFDNILITKENWKMIGDVSFYNPWFKPSGHYRVCDDMINLAGSLSSNTRGFINCWNDSKIKHKIYKILKVLIASKSSKLVLKLYLCVRFPVSKERTFKIIF